MNRRKMILLLVIAVLGGGAWLGAVAETWQGTLKGGGVVRVDPTTKKPTLYYNGGSTQLWDGTHELADGSVLIVRDGVAVPDESMLSTWSWEEQPETMDQTRCCLRLVRKVCGFHDECADARACTLARQLRDLDQAETKGGVVADRGGAGAECCNSLADVALFPPCPADKSAVPTPCTRLVTKVCGDEGQCSAGKACDPARQLLVMERQERLNNPDPDMPTESGMQCKEALGNPFFKACAK